MKDEKEIVKQIKNSKKKGIRKIEIIKKLQSKGYKLEYIDILMKKALIGKLFLFTFIGILLIAGIIATILFYPSWIQEKQNFENPLQKVVANPTNSTHPINIENTEITPDFISYLINEIGGWKLHKNTLTGKPSHILFEIDNQKFYSEIDSKILTSKTPQKNFEKDMIISTSKEEIIKSILSKEPGEYFKASIEKGTTTLSLIAEETNLFAKGYLDLYNEINK